MSLRPSPIGPVPGETARVARAAFRKGNPLLKLRDELGAMFADADFADLFPVNVVSRPARWPSDDVYGPCTPGRTRRRRSASEKGLRACLRAAAAARPGQRIALWFMDEARVGQKGRLCHRWWLKGHRPPGRCDRRFRWAYIFAAVEPATGADVALVLPEATTATMGLFLAEFAAGLPGDVHAVLVLDGAGWHGARALALPPNVTLLPLPP